MVHQSIPKAAAAKIGTELVSLGDIELAFRSVGEGVPVVFIHGLAEDHTSWDPVLERLPIGVRAYALDLRGHGGTTSGRGDGTARQLAGDLLAFLEQVTGPAACVGFSLGGVIVLEAALQRPELIRQAVVVGTSSKVGHAAAAFFRERIEQAQTDMDGFRRALAKDTDAQVVRNRDAIAEISRRRVDAVGDGAGYVNAARAMVALAAAPITERLRGIRVPVHIIQGGEDAFCPRKAADILRDAMPQAGYAEIPDAGHLMTADQPERLALEISRALKI